jgi:hypothetical protein
LAGKFADLLLVAAASGGPVEGVAAVLFLLLVEGEFALDERGGLLFDLGLTSGGPLAQAAAQLMQLLMLLRDPLAQLQQLGAAGRETLLLQFVLFGELQSELRDRLGDFGGREAAGDLRPELFGQQSHLERLPMQGENLAANLLETGLLSLDPILSGLEPLPAVGHFIVGGLQAVFERLPLPRLVLGPGLAVGRERGAIGVELLDLFLNQLLGSLQLLFALADERLELASKLRPLFRQLALLLRPLLFPELLRVSQGHCLPVGIVSPLAQLILAQRHLLLAIGHIAMGILVIGAGRITAVSMRSQPLFQFFDSPPQFRFALLSLGLALGQPEPRRARFGFNLRRAGVKLRFAAIDLAEPLAQMPCELCDLQLQLLAANFCIVADDRRDVES